MPFKEEMEKEGERLYKWRSYIPLLFLLLLPIAFKNGEFIERTFGDRIGDLWEGIAFIISFLGFIVRCFTVGYVPKNTSGRTNSLIAERLNTTGMYSIVRHPLYLGNFLVVFGIV
jgi:protein-S-isoprenylcysteine O-methyltransferase Ste14